MNATTHEIRDPQDGPFLGVSAPQGQVLATRVHVGDFPDNSPIAMPVVVATGETSGPTFYLQAGLHGDEATGIAICHEVLRRLDPRTLRGTVVAVPVVNVPAYLTRTRGYLHEERWLIDINRIFPGNPRGLLSERIASTVFEQFVKPADYTIDLHSALHGCDIAPFVYVDPADDDGGTLHDRLTMARAFGAPYVYHKDRSAKLGTSDLSRSLAAQADQVGRPVMIAEVGESRRVSWHRVPDASTGVMNVLAAVGMIDDPPTEKAMEQRDFSTIHLVHANRGGGLQVHVQLGDHVNAGDVVATIVDPFGETLETLEAHVAGFVLRVMCFDSVGTGAEVVWVAN